MTIHPFPICRYLHTYGIGTKNHGACKARKTHSNLFPDATSSEQEPPPKASSQLIRMHEDEYPTLIFHVNNALLLL